MKELRGSLEDASLLRYFSHCSAGTAQCPPWPGRPSPNPQRGQPGLDLVVGGGILVLQVLCCFSGLEKPNRQRRLYPRRNRTVNFVNSSRSIQHHHHPAPPAPCPPAPCPTAYTHTLTHTHFHHPDHQQQQDGGGEQPVDANRTFLYSAARRVLSVCMCVAQLVCVLLECC